SFIPTDHIIRNYCKCLLWLLLSHSDMIRVRQGSINYYINQQEKRVDIMVKNSREMLQQIYHDVDKLYQYVLTNGRHFYDRWQDKIERQEFIEPAKNLAAYLALRQKDLRPLQQKLIPLGLSSIGR